MCKKLTSKQIAWVNFKLAEEFITSFLTTDVSNDDIQYFAEFIAKFENERLSHS